MTAGEQLSIVDGSVRLSAEQLGGGVRSVWTKLHPATSLVISDAEPGPGDGVDGVTVVSGHMAMLELPRVPVVARSFIDASGQSQLQLRMQLRGENPVDDAWVFSRSFPDMPHVWDHGQTLSGTQSAREVLAKKRPYVDSLQLYETEFVLCSTDGVDAELGVPLESGLNLVSRLRPQGALGILETSAGAGGSLTIAGPLRIPAATDIATPLDPFERVWAREGAPGIHLSAPLGLDATIGPLELRDWQLRVYTPHSQDWLEDNDTYGPRQGYVGKLRIPSADIELAVSVDMLWGAPKLELRADCTGVSLDKLTKLADIAGSGDLLADLPDDLSGLIRGLGKLELTQLGATIGVEQGRLTLGGVSLTIGLPGLEWKVWDDDLIVRDIACRFDISSPQGSPTIAVSLMATARIEGVDVELIGTVIDGFTLFAKLADGETIPLERLLGVFAKGTPAPSDLTVDRLAMTLAPGRSLGLSLVLAGEPNPWVIPVGKSKLSLANLTLELDSSRGQPTTGRYAGSVPIGNFALAASGDLDGNLTLRGTFEDLKLSGLVELVAEPFGGLPKGFDLTLDQLVVLVSKQGRDYGFSAAAQLESYGTFAFVARKLASGGAGFACGLSLAPKALAKLGGLEALAAFDALDLQQLTLVVSSFDDAKFVFPDMAAFNQPVLATKQVALPGSGGVVAGFNLTAAWQLDAKNKQHKLIKKLLGLGKSVQVTVQVGSDPRDARLFVASRGKISGHAFDYQFGIQLTDGRPSVFLTGSMVVSIQKQKQTFALTTAFVPSGAFLSANLSGTAAIDCGPFKISNLALLIGVNWGGIPSLGVAGSITTKRFSSSIAAFFDSTDPSKSLLAGSISPTSLADLADALLGLDNYESPIDDVLAKVRVEGTQEFAIETKLAKALDERELDGVIAAFDQQGGIKLPTSTDQLVLVALEDGKRWHLSELETMRHYDLVRGKKNIEVSVSPQLYFAPQTTSIGTARFAAGYYINAAISFFGFDASVTIELNVNKGVVIDAQMDPLTILDKRLFSIAASEGKGGPRLSLASYRRPKYPDPQFRNPHFYIDGKLTLLGVSTSVHASVSSRGIDFEISGKLGVAKYDVDIAIDNKGLEARGDIDVGVGKIDLGELGKIKLDTDVEASIELDIDKNGAKLKLKAKFRLAGERIDLGSFTLAVESDTLKNLPKTLERKVEAELRKIFKDADRWVAAVGKGAVEGVEDVGRVLDKTFGRPIESAAKDVGKAAEDAGKAVGSAAKSTGKAAEKAAKSIGGLFRKKKKKKK